MGAMVLACGRGADVAPSALAGRPGVTMRRLPSAPGKDHVDPVLRLVGPDAEHDRLVVLGADADLAAVVLRLLRRERLDVPVGFVALDARSAAVANWGLPVNGDQALDVALAADPQAVPLVRDDNGGVLVGLGRLGPLRGVAYCDDAQVLRGPAREIRVTPHAAGVAVAVAPMSWFHRTTVISHGRAFQLGCLPTRVIRDGVANDRPVQRWTWYRHTEDLLLVRAD
ncbi:MAG TPA: hypothetical protein VFW65_02465 [Pseudonocardiaceae bacterium]|nr:hypothetical protein [Pseudonocardiaceae bacterium]